MWLDIYTKREGFVASTEVRLPHWRGTDQGVQRTLSHQSRLPVILTIRSAPKILRGLRSDEKGTYPCQRIIRFEHWPSHPGRWNRGGSDVGYRYSSGRAYHLDHVPISESFNADPFVCQVLKSRLQSAPTGTYSGIVDCARKTIAVDGVKALWKGFGPAMARVRLSWRACEYSLLLT
jgi:Mitochondrial carrier protein